MTRTVKVVIGAEIGDLKAKLREGGAAVRQFGTELGRAAKGGHLDELARHAGLLGVGLAGVAVAAVKMRMDFDKAMSGAAAATNANAVELNRLRQAALDAGKSTQFSATQAAQGITELGKAGVSTQAILGGGLKGALDLAAAGQISVGEAAETAASAMTQFKLSGSAIPHLADLLAAGAGKAQGSVHDMGAALNQSGLVAAQFGLSVEDTTGVLAEFASAGLTGSDAGTSLKTMLLALANPTTQTKAVMDKLGLSFYDASGQFVGLAGVAQVLQTKLKGLTQEQRNAALGQIFGNDAIRSASVLYADGAAGVDKWRNAVNDSGFATQTAAKLTDNLAGDIERLKGSVETLAIESGGGANDGLRVLAKSANAAVDAFSSLPSGVQSTLTVLSGVGGVALLAGAGFIKARGTAKDLMTELQSMGPMGTRAAAGLGKIGAVAGKLGLIGAASTVALIGFKAFADWAVKRSAPAKANIDALTESMKEFAATGRVTGELASKFGDHLQKISEDVVDATSGMKQASRAMAEISNGQLLRDTTQKWNPLDPQAVQRIKDLDTALTSLVQNGGASQAQIFLQQLRGSGQLTADQFQRLIGMLPNYANATKGAAAANTGLAQGFGSAQANATTMTGSLESAVQAGQKLIDVWTQLNGALLSSDQAALSAAQAIDAVKKSFHDNGKAIDGNSEKALKNRIAVGQAAKAAAEAAQAKYEETGSVSAASAVYNSYIGQLRKTLMSQLHNKASVDALLSAYAKMPPSVTTNVSAKGAARALGQVRSLKDELASMRTNWTVTVRTRFLQFGKPYSEQGIRSGDVGGLARGGAMVPMAAGGIYPASNPPLIKFAEPETGGELYVPKRGISRARARGLLAQGAAWHGLGITPMAAGGVTAAATGLVNVAPGSSSTGFVPTGTHLDTLEALLRARDAVAALSAALKENGKSWSMSTQKGRENRSALIAGIRAAQDAARAKYAETGSVKQANRAYDAYIRQLDASMKKMGINAKTRRDLLRAYGERPKYDLPAAAAPSNSSKNIALMQGRIAANQQIDATAKAFAWTKPTFRSDTEAGQAELTQLFSLFGAAEQAAQAAYDQSGNVKTATAVYNGYIAQLRGILSRAGMDKKSIDKLLQTYGRITLTKNRWGGVYQHAASGSLRDAMIAPGGTRYAWAEPETGGELFAPKRGNLAKTRAEVGWAVSNWWGGQVSWSPGPARAGAAARQVAITVPVSLDLGGGDRIERRMELVVDTALGKLASATVYQDA